LLTFFLSSSLPLFLLSLSQVFLSSEVGVLPDLDEARIVEKRRLEPGKMFLVDLDKQKIVEDSEIKAEAAANNPYRSWLDEHHFEMEQWAADKGAEVELPGMKAMTDTNRRLNMFGFSTESMEMMLQPMSITAHESLGSMGNDAPLAVLSQQPRPPFDYFKQLFAQVTNPPIDPIRESCVMSLSCPVGPEGNLLEIEATQAKRMTINHPVLSTEQLQVMKDTTYRGWKAKTLDATFPANSDSRALVESIERLCDEAASAVQGEFGVDGFPLLLISDRLAGPDRFPIPSLLAAGAVHQHLIRTQQRARTAILVESGDCKEVHDFATLIGFGADGVCPYMAYEALSKMNADGLISAHAGEDIDDADLIENYQTAIGKGILKVMSKIGISTLQSYKGAQIFEAVGLNDDIIDMCFTGTDR
jgi:hypothetical protein